MSKFQVGDKVKVLAYHVDNQAGGAIGKLFGERYVGKVFEISDVWQDRAYHFTKESRDKGGVGTTYSYVWDEHLLRRIRKAKPQAVVAEKVAIKPAAEAKPAVPAKPIKTDFSAEILAMRKELAQISDNYPGLCSFAKYTVKNGVGKVNMHHSAPCHANINNWAWGIEGAHLVDCTIEALILNVQGHRNQFGNQKDKDNYTRFVDYMVNRSPFKAAFVPTKDIEEYFKDGVVCDVNSPIFVVKAGAVALREKTEFASSFVAFNKLVDAGFSENTAEVLSACFNVVGKTWKFKDFCNSHQVWLSAFEADDFLRFIKEGYTKEKMASGPYRTTYRDNSIAIHMCKRNAGKTISQYIKDGVGIKPADPRAWANAEANLNVTEEVMLKFAEQLDNILN